MRWRKIGKIFDPASHRLPNGCTQFAQSPQTLVFDDFVRIYFSTRSVDPKNGKYLSHIAFVDMRKNLRDIIAVSDQTVLPLGELGCFDEHGIFPINVVRDGDQILAYTTGWQLVGIGVSRYRHWAGNQSGRWTDIPTGRTRASAVGLAARAVPCRRRLRQENRRCLSHVVHFRYRLETFRSGLPPQTGHTRSALATSTDGIEWKKQEATQIIADRLGPNAKPGAANHCRHRRPSSHVFLLPGIVRLQKRKRSRIPDRTRMVG